MNIEPIIFFDLIIAIFTLSAALVGVVIYFSHAQKKQSLQQNTDLLDEARQKAVEMIDAANNQALDIVNKTNLSADIASGNFNQQIARITSLQIKEFEKTTANFLKLYGEVLRDLQSKNIELLQNISKNIETDTINEINNFKESLEKQTVLSEDLVREKIDADYLTVRQEIEAYKEKKLKKIDDEIYETLEKISKLVLGKALSLSEHEDLILKSLEKAKQEGVFEQ